MERPPEGAALEEPAETSPPAVAVPEALPMPPAAVEEAVASTPMEPQKDADEPPAEALDVEEAAAMKEGAQSPSCTVLMEVAPRVSGRSSSRTSRHRSTSRPAVTSRSPRSTRSPRSPMEGDASVRSVLSEARPRISAERDISRGRSSSAPRLAAAIDGGAADTSTAEEAAAAGGFHMNGAGPPPPEDAPGTSEQRVASVLSDGSARLPVQARPRSLSRPRSSSRGRPTGRPAVAAGEALLGEAGEQCAPGRVRSHSRDRVFTFAVEGDSESLGEVVAVKECTWEEVELAGGAAEEVDPEKTVALPTVLPESGLAGGAAAEPEVAEEWPGSEGAAEKVLDSSVRCGGFGGSFSESHSAPEPVSAAPSSPLAEIPLSSAEASGDATDDSVISVRQPLLQARNADPFAGDFEAVRGRFGEALRWDCGRQRQLLRQEFNSHEISAAILLRRYDRDHSGLLEADELRGLLQDYNGGRPVRDEELRFVMLAADANRDDCISSEELLFALKVWYAFKRMPKSVGAAFTRYRIGGGPLPSVATLRECMVTLNDSLPVPVDEVQRLLATAVRLGGSEELVTTEQMRKAVATWYLHVERDETAHLQLAGDAHKVAVRQLALGVNFVQEMVHGPPEEDMADPTDSAVSLDLHGGHRAGDRRQLLAVFGLGVACLLLACLELWAGRDATSEACEKRLSGLLSFTGVTLLLATILNCGAFVICALRRRPAGLPEEWIRKIPYPAIPAALVVANLVHLVTLITGFSWVTMSSPERCGVFLWETCSFIYVLLPLLLACSLCCGPCCCYCCLSAVHGLDRYSTDRRLMEP